MNNNANMAPWYEREIPEGYEARIEGNKIIFELKESKHERMSKNCIHFLKLQKAHHADTSEIDDCIAYLEHLQEYIDDVRQYAYNKGLVDAKEKQKPAEKQDYSDLNDFERAIHRGFLSAGVENVPVAIIKETAQECLAQMKPAEWSEDDKNKFDLLHTCICHCINDPHWEYSKREKVSKEIIPFIEKLKSIRSQSKIEWSEDDEDYLMDVKSAVNHYFDEGYAEELCDWLKFLKERFNFQPKQEWNEEDKYILKNIHDFVKENTINPNRVNCAEECLNWLESLPERFNPQPMQKWSEDDENMLKTIFDSLETYAKNTLPCLKSVVEDEIAWLKSLRPQPHWKPSEAQMAHLIKLRDCVAEVSGYWGEMLSGLIHDLQKLIDSKN